MNKLIYPAIGLGIYALISSAHTIKIRNDGYERSLTLSGEKGIINIGSGCYHNAYAMDICLNPKVVTNVDIDEQPNGTIADLELAQLPFSDNQFDVVLAENILEHLVNWKENLTEWSRIADHVIVVFPPIWSLGGFLHPDHVNHFNGNDISFIRDNYPKVEVFS